MRRILCLIFALLFCGIAPAQVAVDASKTGHPQTATLLCASAVASSVTGTLSETVLATCTIPAGAMGVNGGIRVVGRWSITNSANAKTINYRLGGIGGTVISGGSHTTIGQVTHDATIRNRNSQSSQFRFTTGTTGAGNAITGYNTGASAIDTSVAQDLVFTGQLALATEAITLESYEVWLLP